MICTTHLSTDAAEKQIVMKLEPSQPVPKYKRSYISMLRDPLQFVIKNVKVALPQPLKYWLKTNFRKMASNAWGGPSSIIFEECLGLIRNSADPIASLDILLAGNHISERNAAHIIRLIFTNRDPAFFRINECKTISNSGVLNIVAELYTSEYHGISIAPELLLERWDTILASGYKLSKSEELYFLLASIKSSALDLAERILSEMQTVQPRDLPPTYKTGILRMVIAMQPTEYLRMRSKLKLSQLEVLQNAELDYKMNMGSIRTHRAILDKLSTSVSSHLRDELETRILPFFRKHSKQMKWMDCRLDTEVRDAFIAVIAMKLDEKAAWSLIRLGDGESYAWQSGLPMEQIIMREKIWWGAAIQPELRQKISSEVRHSIASADVLGVPSPFRFARDTSIDLEAFSKHRSISGLLHVLDCVSELPATHRQFTEDRIHQVCFDLPTVLSLGKHASKVVVVSSLLTDIVRKCLARLDDETPCIYVEVPTHTKTQGNSLYVASDDALPLLYDDINDRIAQEVEPGTLVIIASGIIGKIFCQTVRDNGGVAVDVGSMVDYWVGIKTRSIADIVI